jgi:prolyl 4-hydroxylase
MPPSFPLVVGVFVLVFVASTLFYQKAMRAASSTVATTVRERRDALHHGAVSRRRPSTRPLNSIMPAVRVTDERALDPVFFVTDSANASAPLQSLPTIADVTGKTTGAITIPSDPVEQRMVDAAMFAAFMANVQANESHFLPLLRRPTFWSKLKDQKPRLIYVHQTLPDEFADDIVRIAQSKIQRSRVIAQNSGGSEGGSKGQEVSPVRTSHGMFITDWNDLTQPAVISLRLRAARLVGVSEECLELTQVLRYEGGQFYKSHLDAFDTWDHANMDRGGQRIATMLTWLNDVPQGLGGDTSFPLAGIKIAPRKGDSVLFYNVEKDLQLDMFAEHGGNPPANGTVKWCAVLWIHPRKFV